MPHDALRRDAPSLTADPSAARAASIFRRFAAAHLVAWTAVPALVNHNLPLDVIEALAWGRQWQWGYDKHPPLSAWAAEAAATLSMRADWSLYLLSQICVVLGFWAIWRLGRELFTPMRALLAALLLEGVHYHHFTSPEFNVNVLQIPLWGLAFLLFWRAQRDDRLRDWAVLGLVLGLAALTKYLAVFLLAPLGLFMLLDARARARLLCPGPYIAAALAAAVFASHALWMFEHDFITIRYALGRADAGESSILDHAINPLNFVAAQAFACALTIPLALALRSAWTKQHDEDRSRRLYILLIALAPVLTMAALSLATGFRLRSMWGTPMLLGVSLLVASRIDPARLTRADARKFALTWAIVFLAPLLAYAVMGLLGPNISGKAKRTHFPGAELAVAVQQRWQERFPTPLRFALGDEWHAGNIGWHAPTRPAVFIDADPSRSPSIRDEDVALHGGVVVWQLRRNDALDAVPEWVAALTQRFGSVRIDEPLILRPATTADVPPVRIGLAWIPPAPAPATTDPAN